jgi:hypothetical protein
MLLVLDTDRELYLFSTIAEAETWLEAIDIENEEYDFCDESGQRFGAEITFPITGLGSDAFRLVPQGERDMSLPLTFWASACHLARSSGEIMTLDDLSTRLQAKI